MAFVDGAAPPSTTSQGGEQGMRSTWTIGGSQVRDVVEGMVKRIWKEVKGVDLEGWFRVMPYEVAMDVVSAARRGEAPISPCLFVCCQEALMMAVRIRQARHAVRDVCECIPCSRGFTCPRSC